MKKRGELVLCRSQSFSLFSLSFVPLLWGSVTLWHLQVTVALIGCNTSLSLSAEKNLAMIYLELFYCWRWSRFSFPSLPSPSHRTKQILNLPRWACALQEGDWRSKVNRTLLPSKQWNYLGFYIELQRAGFDPPTSTGNKSGSLSCTVRHSTPGNSAG